jgi:hypothetical protein
MLHKIHGMSCTPTTRVVSFTSRLPTLRLSSCRRPHGPLLSPRVTDQHKSDFAHRSFAAQMNSGPRNLSTLWSLDALNSELPELMSAWSAPRCRVQRG